MKRNLFVLFLITVLGALLRFYNLGAVPVGFHRDEAYFGYTAYSLLKTGMDMTGNFLPLHFESLLFSPGGYAYFSMPSILLFGLSEFSIRFAAAFFGTLTVLLVYILVNILFDNNRLKEKIGLLSALLLAISPWHINLSRTSAEIVIVVFLIILGIVFYIKWKEKNKLYLLFLSFACFFISLYTYQAPRSFLPLFLPVLFIYFCFRDKKKLLFSFLIYLIVIIVPVLSVISSNELSLRFKMLSILNSPSTQLLLDEQLREDGVMQIPPIMARVFHNKVFGYLSTFLVNYSDHFSYRFIFTDSGFPDRYRVPGVGLLYIFELPLLIFGLYSLFNKHRKLFLFLTGWILLVPIGSALTYDDVPNLQRTLIVFPVLAIISANGFFVFWDIIKKLGVSKIILTSVKGLLIIIITFNIFYYLHSYYVQQIVHRPWYRQEGYKNLISALNLQDKENLFKKIVITQSHSDPAIFFIFYNKKDPKEVQKLFKTVKNGNFGNVSFDKYVFSREECPLHEVLATNPKTLANESFVNGQEGTLYVNSGTCKMPEGGEILSTINRNDGTTVFIVAKVKKGARIFNGTN